MTQVIYDKETKNVMMYIRDGVMVLPSCWGVLEYGDSNEPVLIENQDGSVKVVTNAMLTTMHLDD